MVVGFGEARRKARAQYPITRRDGRWWIGDLDFDARDDAAQIRDGLVADTVAELMGLGADLGEALCVSAMAGVPLTAGVVREALLALRDDT